MSEAYNMFLYNTIVWDPDGTIIDLGFYALRWYSLLFSLGFIICYVLLKKHYKEAGLSEKSLEKLTVYVVLGTVIGARLGHCLFYDFDYYSHYMLEIFLPFQFYPEFRFVGFQGLASHGGILGVLLGVIGYARMQKVDLMWVFDKLCLVAPLAFICIRVGNLMNSEIVGKPTMVSWAFIFPQVDDLPRHPAQLYEAVLYLLIFGVLNLVHHKLKHLTGMVFGLALVLLFSARLAVEFLKEDQSAFEAGMLLNMGQLLSIPFIFIGLLIIWFKVIKAGVVKQETPLPGGS